MLFYMRRSPGCEYILARGPYVAHELYAMRHALIDGKTHDIHSIKLTHDMPVPGILGLVIGHNMMYIMVLADRSIKATDAFVKYYGQARRYINRQV